MFTIYLAAVIISIIISIFCKKINIASILTVMTTLIIWVISFLLIHEIKGNTFITYHNGLIYIDPLNLIQLLLISTISVIGAIYSHRYIKNELEEGQINLFSAKLYYVLFNTFVFSMILVAVSNNIIVMWIGLEATTLSTAFLIGFDRQKLSLEAAWKYIIICSVGISIGLLGIILMIYSADSSSSEVLRWNFLVANSYIINPNIAKFAFALIFIGVGTKSGLAPMHTWLPDGHSESPSPISAMMSGVLLNLALYVVIRFYTIIKHIPGLEKTKYLFVIFGILSLIIASFSIIRQKNYKRLLAFSSVENMGIIALGIGIGGKLALYGAILHSIIHAFGKTLLFLISGNILSVYKTKKIEKVNNLIKVMPINAIMLILAVLVITGVPPFAAFVSEYSILIGMINNGYYILSGIYLLCLLIVFSGFINIFIKMVFNNSDEFQEKSKLDKVNIIPLFITFAIILIISFSSTEITSLINRAIMIID